MQQTRIFCLAMLAAAAIVLPQAALAEFDIQEAGMEKGETELEYRGAYHWGVPEATVKTKMPTISFKVTSSSCNIASPIGSLSN